MRPIDTLRRNNLDLRLFGDGKGSYRLTCFDGGAKIVDREYSDVESMRSDWFNIASDNDMLSPPF